VSQVQRDASAEVETALSPYERKLRAELELLETAVKITRKKLLQLVKIRRTIATQAKSDNRNGR
jgi:hypothetical protein